MSLLKPLLISCQWCLALIKMSRKGGKDTRKLTKDRFKGLCSLPRCAMSPLNILLLRYANDFGYKYFIATVIIWAGIFYFNNYKK